MTEFLSALSSYPAVLCTVLLGVALSYWLLVLAGAASGDALGGHDGAHGGVDAHDVGADHGHADHGHAEGHATVHDAAAAVGLFGGLKRIPTTLAVTLVTLSWWLQNLLVTHYLGAKLSATMPVWLWGSLSLALTLPVALAAAALLARPLVPVFTSSSAITRKELVGSVVEVRTSKVDRRFGQAHAADGGAGLLLEVRCETDGALRRGDRAIVIAYDEERELYEIAPLEDLLERRR